MKQTIYFLKYKLPVVACIFVLMACLEDRVFPPAPVPAGSNADLKPGMLKINEIQNVFDSTVGDNADWVELYNPTDSVLILEPQRFWITESKTNKFQYTPIQRYSIPAKGFFTVYFKNNGLENIPGAIVNINGSLSSAGEFAGFYFLNNAGDTLVLDTVSFPASSSNKETYGRLPDGSGQFQKLKTVTRNTSNNVNTPDVQPPTDIIPNGLRINEIQADFQADSLDKADWVELYNSSDLPITIKKDQFWISTSKTTLLDYTVQRSYTIAPKGFLTIYFQSPGTDNSNDYITYPKGNLSKDGEFVGISFKKTSGEVVVLDSFKFPAFTLVAGRFQSWGRFPDGGNFKFLADITRNISNNTNGVVVIPPVVEPYAGMFVINEIAPNETPDWVEFVSTLPGSFTMKAGRWFFTDDLAAKTKDTLKVNFFIGQGSYNVMECSSSSPASTSAQLRAKLGLSSTSGEAFGIYYLNDSNELITIAEQTFPAGIESGKSYARQPNLSGPFVSNITPSKGQPNP